MARKTTAAAPGGEEEFGQVFGPMAILTRWEADDTAWHFPASMIEQAAGTAPCYVRAREERLRKLLTPEAPVTPKSPQRHAWRLPDRDPARAAEEVGAGVSMVGMGSGGEW